MRSTNPMDEHPVKKIRLKYQCSRLESSKVPPLTLKQKGKKLMFEDDLVMQPSNEVSQDTMLVAHGGETLPDRYITDLEWTM